MKILVTGAAGFIGSHLTEKLLSQGHEVLAIDNLSSGKMGNLPTHKLLMFKKADVRDEEGMMKAASGVDLIYHLAADPLVKESADHPVQSFEINVRGTLNLLEAARANSVKGFVFTSTSAAYGDAKVFPTPEDQPCAPISNYAASKVSAEAYVSAYSSTYGLKATIFRFANIYGPRSAHGVMHDFYHKLKKNPLELQILGNGKQSKSYLYVSDCVEAASLAHEKQAGSLATYNVGTEAMASVDDLAREISGVMSVSPRFTYTGGERGWAGDVSKMRLDIRKIREEAGWEPKVPLREGIRLYLNWLSSSQS